MLRAHRFFLISLLISLTAFSAYAVSEKFMSVQVKKGQVRSAPSFLGKVISTVAYGVRVTVQSEESGWASVTVPGKRSTGWMHTSALTKKKIVMKAGAADIEQAASGDEIAIAGKGFNSEVEKEYRSRNRGLDYSRVDAMEKIIVSQGEIQRFVKAGGLAGAGGAR